MERTFIDKVRDNIAWAIANFALYIATSRYRKMISGAIRYGMLSAATDSELQYKTKVDYATLSNGLKRAKNEE